MPERKKVVKPSESKRAPATTPEARNKQLVALAYDLVEERMREGVASAQETVHFLKMYSPRELLEQARIAADVELAEKKVEAMNEAVKMEQLYREAMDAFRGYGGLPSIEPGQDDYLDEER